MKVAIAGAGNVGRFLAEDLARNGHEVRAARSNADRLASLPPIEGVRYVTADACEVSSLQAAHFDEMDVVVATTGDDEDNLVISQLAKQEFAVPRVIARVNHPKNHWLFNEMWGVDVAVSTPHLLAGLVEEAVSVGTLVRLLQFEGGHTRLMEVTSGRGLAGPGQRVRGARPAPWCRRRRSGARRPRGRAAVGLALGRRGRSRAARQRAM